MEGHLHSITTLEATRSTTLSEVQAIHDAAQNENRELTDEERTSARSLMDRIGNLDEDIARVTLLDAEATRQANSGESDPLGNVRNPDREWYERTRRFSVRALLAHHVQRALMPDAASRHLLPDIGFETEIQQELEKRSDRTPSGDVPGIGLTIPLNALLPHPDHIDAVLATRNITGSDASNLRPTEHLADQYIPGLRNAPVAERLGARVIRGLRGNVAIPAANALAAVGWVADDSAFPETTPTFQQKTMSPKLVGGWTEYSRLAMLQSSPELEQLLRDDLSMTVNRAIDLATFVDAGANGPDGIGSDASNIFDRTNDTNGKLMDYGEVVAMESAVEAANLAGDNGQMLAWAINAKTKGRLRRTYRPNEARPNMPIYDNRRQNIDGTRTAISNALPSDGTKGTGTNLSTVVVGDWSQLILGFWEDAQVVVNPYAESQFKKGSYLIRVIATADMARRYDAAWQRLTDVVN